MSDVIEIFDSSCSNIELQVSCSAGPTFELDSGGAQTVFWSNVLDKPSIFPSDSSKFVLGEKVTVDWNGLTSGFNTNYSFHFNKIAIFHNGLRLETEHYATTSSSGINLSFTPLSGDLITIDYILE